MFLIEVQDILIIFQHLLSQEVLIKDRIAIVFSQISDKKRRKYENIRKMVKLHAKYNVKKLKIVEILLPGSLFKGGCLLDFWKIPPRMLIRDRTCIRNTRVNTFSLVNRTPTFANLPRKWQYQKVIKKVLWYSYNVTIFSSNACDNRAHFSVVIFGFK